MYMSRADGPAPSTGSIQAKQAISDAGSNLRYIANSKGSCSDYN